jgi:uncharacterized protein (DUF433 family)
VTTTLNDAELRGLRDALRAPRGHYGAARAAQLSGVPSRTLYDWAANDVLVPDFADESPRAWSYRDLVYARLCAWLRAKNMPRSDVARRVAQYRLAMAAPGDDGATLLHSDGRVITPGDASVDPDTGVAFFDTLAGFADTFDLLEPVERAGQRTHWGPNLVRPSVHTAMSPWIVGGEPCVRDTRLPTASLYALHLERRLDAAAIARLYPGVTKSEVTDAIALEERLHRAA